MTNNILPQRPTLLLTRPQKDAQAFAQEVLSHQPAAQILISPVLTITPIGTLPDLSAYAAVVFTSRHAVACFAHAPIPKKMTCFAVGEATAEAAKKLGFFSDKQRRSGARSYPIGAKDRGSRATYSPARAACPGPDCYDPHQKRHPLRRMRDL